MRIFDNIILNPNHVISVEQYEKKIKIGIKVGGGSAAGGGGSTGYGYASGDKEKGYIVAVYDALTIKDAEEVVEHVEYCLSKLHGYDSFSEWGKHKK